MNYVNKHIIKRIKPRKKRAHKGAFGRVLIIGGSYGYCGAPALAALAGKAVLRSGADYVTVVAPDKVAWAINTLSPDIITKKIKVSKGYFETRHAKKVISLAKKYDVVLIGCGIGEKSNGFIKKVCKGIKKPKVIDADAIKAVSLSDVKNAIFTPHLLEYSKLIKNSKIKNMLRLRQQYLKTNVILIKTTQDKIMSKEKLMMNKTGNSVMTKAGTGDVLAGLVAGFLAQMVKQKPKRLLKNMLFDAACLGAYVNGKTGDYLRRRKGRTFIASDLVENVYRVCK